MRLLSVLLVVTLIAPSVSAQEQLDIRRLMTQKQLEASGVSGLSTKEIHALNAWVNQFGEQVWDLAIQSANGQVKSATPSADAPSVIESQIDGEFQGWDGETIFKLTNGQIWQQASYAYTYHYAYMPEVLIYRRSGAYVMRVEGVTGTIQVVRLR